jgi:hypothetical protein
MTPLPFDYARCDALEPDQYCKNCKRWAAHPEQTWGSLGSPCVTVKDSRDEACIYIPISFEKVKK